MAESYTFYYKIKAGKYFREGKINSGKYKDFLIKEEFEKLTSAEPLKNSSLEGVWTLKTGQRGEMKYGIDVLKDVTVIKIFAYPRFGFAWYKKAS